MLNGEMESERSGGGGGYGGSVRLGSVTEKGDPLRPALSVGPQCYQESDWVSDSVGGHHDGGDDGRRGAPCCGNPERAAVDGHPPACYLGNGYAGRPTETRLPWHHRKAAEGGSCGDLLVTHAGYAKVAYTHNTLLYNTLSP